jgi:diguanylate cyclase (GGDEF)-like protein
VRPIESPDADAPGPAAVDSAPVDVVTGLPGRDVFLARLRRCTAPHWCVDGLFVLLIDLERFREINDRLGFAGGDRVLAEMAARVRRRIRPSDSASRFGPDEFAVLLSGVQSGPDATRVAERLVRELAAPFEIQGHTLTARASIGIALGVAGARPEDIVREAERALGRAKVMGRSSVPAARAGQDADEASLLFVETALRRALEEEEIHARYRPTVRRKDGRVPGFEIVLWRRPPVEDKPSEPASHMRRAG